MGRFETWSTSHGPFSGKVGVLQRQQQRLRQQHPQAASSALAEPVGVKDVEGFLEAIHIFAIHHYLTVSL